MAMDPLFLIIALIVLLIGTYTDIKTREVPDWLNFGLIAAALGSRLILSAALGDWSHIMYGVAGLAVFFALAHIMFYSGQWGGGDAKLVMGLGALFGIEVSTYGLWLSILAAAVSVFVYSIYFISKNWKTLKNDISKTLKKGKWDYTIYAAAGVILYFSLDFNGFSISFIVNSFILGALFAVGYSIYLIFKNWKDFKKELVKIRQKKAFKLLRICAVGAVLAGILMFLFIDDVLLKFYAATPLFLIVLMLYFWLLIKAVEKSGMYKLVEPSKLTEGDWIAKDIKVNGKHIAGPKDLGIEMKQIEKLIELHKKGKISKVLIKEGMPFVPSFLASFIFTYFFGSMLHVIVNALL